MLRDPGEGALDGEIDFVLCHPEKAILCLEVKGGGIECRHGEWFRFVDGKRKRAEDPFKQALDHRYDLERLLDRVDGIRARGLLLVHGLAFPDITEILRNYGVNYLPGTGPGDSDSDGIVDFADVTATLRDFGPCP